MSELARLECEAQGERVSKLYRESDDMLLLVEFVETREYGKRVKPWAPDLEWHYSVWFPRWYDLDYGSLSWTDADKRGWRVISRNEAEKLLDGASVDDLERWRQETAEEQFARIAHNRSQDYWPSWGAR